MNMEGVYEVPICCISLVFFNTFFVVVGWFKKICETTLLYFVKRMLARK